MKFRTRAFLVAALASTAGWSQEFSVTSTTLAQLWKQEIPGFDKATFAPATQFLGIDATGLGDESLSLHLYGWGRTDLKDQSAYGGKSGGELTYGFVRYRFKQANAEIQAGRFAVHQGVAVEQVDGVSARADLRGGFTISAFGGRPVWFKTRDAVTQKDYEFQRDFIFGTRLGLRFAKVGEIGVSYLQDGTGAAKDLPIPSTTDYHRKQMGVDLSLTPVAALRFSGRTLFDIAQHPDPAPGKPKPSKIAEHDYSATWKVSGNFALTGAYTERNFEAFFAGTNLPSLFRPQEKDKHRGWGGGFVVGSGGPLVFVADYRHTTRETYGDANRFGGELRWNIEKLKFQSGFGYHRVTASDVAPVDAVSLAYGLSHHEARAWAMVQKGKLSGSLDGIVHKYDDEKNPHLYGRTTVFEVVASLGHQATSNLKVSADLSYAANPLFKKEVRGLLRAEYRFVSAAKGGSK